MAGAGRPGGALPAGGALRVGRHDLHPHLGPRAGAGAPLPDQPLRRLVRRDDRLGAGEDRPATGNILQDTPYFVNAAGFTIHSAVHMNREDAHFVMHLHTDQGAAVSAQKEGLLPLTQHALIVLPQAGLPRLRGHRAQPRRARAAGRRPRPDSTLMLLRNHGTLALGATAGRAAGPACSTWSGPARCR